MARDLIRQVINLRGAERVVEFPREQKGVPNVLIGRPTALHDNAVEDVSDAIHCHRSEL